MGMILDDLRGGLAPETIVPSGHERDSFRIVFDNPVEKTGKRGVL